MIGVERDVRVMATLIEAAKQRHATGMGMLGKRNVNALPNAAPAAKKGKMKPPRYPPATVNEMATSFANPTKKQVRKEFISNPKSPDVGKTCANDFAGAKVAIV